MGGTPCIIEKMTEIVITLKQMMIAAKYNRRDPEPGYMAEVALLLNDKVLLAWTLVFLLNDRRLDVLLMVREDRTFD
jgi:hypothetical protein